MAELRVQMIFPRDTNVPADVSMNTLHFRTDGTVPLDADVTAVVAKVSTFMQAIASRMSQLVNSPAQIKVYNLADPQPRQPIRLTNVDIIPSTSTLPEECAVCISFQAARVSGVNQRRRRNRIYVGPLADIDVVTSGRTRVNGADQTFLRNAAETLLETTPAQPWIIHTESTLPGSWPVVTDGWVDDAFDTQRRRGPAPTSRILFPVP